MWLRLVWKLCMKLIRANKFINNIKFLSMLHVGVQTVVCASFKEAIKTKNFYLIYIFVWLNSRNDRRISKTIYAYYFFFTIISSLENKWYPIVYWQLELSLIFTDISSSGNFPVLIIWLLVSQCIEDYFTNSAEIVLRSQKFWEIIVFNSIL